MDAGERRELRRELASRLPLLTDPEVGPSTVEAGECDRCGIEPRVVSPCGPLPWAALGRRCALELGVEAWCDGHRDDARRALEQLAGLPEDVDRLVRLWWVATGEVRVPDGR